MFRDYSDQVRPTSRNSLRFHVPAAGVLLAAVVIALIARPGDAFRQDPQVDGPLATDLPELLARDTTANSANGVTAEHSDALGEDFSGTLLASLSLPRRSAPRDDIGLAPLNGTATSTDNGTAEAVDEPWDVVTVPRGQTLSGLFDSIGLPPSQWLALLKLEHDDISRLRRLRAGDELQIRRDGARLDELKLALDELNTLHVVRGPDGFKVDRHTDEVETRQAYAYGEIASSLFLSGKRAGLSDNLIMSMVDILGFDIDFALDLRTGDRFTVIYEELYRDGEKVRDGRILAIEFLNQRRTVQAFRHVADDGKVGYYRADGESVKTAFLRNPLDVFRISSHFNPNRRHPVLNTIRAHRGTDYAAPTGTPIRATGDGVVTHAGNRGGYGITVIVQHGSTYETLYAHMSRIRNGVRRGSRVRQGQVIGYVGMTGLATGPHLHFEFLVNGRHRNPLTVPLPRSEPLPKSERVAFDANVKRYVAQLDTLRGTETATAEAAGSDAP